MIFTFTIEGNIAADPALRYLANGTPVCELRIMRTSRFRRDGNWVDGQTISLSLTCWRELAERVAELHKGDTVVVEVGDDLHGESFQGRAYLRATARTVAVSMRWAGASSLRERRPGDDPRDPAGSTAPVTGGYDSGADGGYVAPHEQPDGDPTYSDASADQPQDAPARRTASRRPSKPSLAAVQS